MQQDSLRIDSLYKQAYANYSSYSVLKTIDELVAEAKHFNDKRLEINALQLKVGSYFNLGMLDRVKELSDSVDVAGVKTVMPQAYYYIKFVLSQAYSYQGKYKLSMNVAMELYDDSQGFESEEFSDDIGTVIPLKILNRLNALSCLATAEHCMGHYEEAIAYNEECLKITGRWPHKLYSERRDAMDGRMLSGLKIKDKERSLRYVQEFEEYLEEYKKIKGELKNEDENYEIYEYFIHDSYVNVYLEMGRLEEAENHVDKIKGIFSSIQQARDNIAGSYYVTMARYAMTVRNYGKALVFADSAAFYNRGFDSSAELDAMKMKLKANHGLRNFTTDYDIAQEILVLVDSMNREMTQSNIEELSTLLGMDKLKVEAQEAKMKQRTWMMSLVALAVFAIAGVVIATEVQKKRREREKRRMLAEQNEKLEQEVANQTRELREKNEEILTQNEILDEKNRIISESNREMTDSISYAKRIQSALLPDLKQYGGKYHLAGLYTVFLPRDIVSGDFYWAKERVDELMIACADCTGHGVPGAFMSMIGTTILNELSSTDNSIEPSEVLTKLDRQIIEALSNTNDSALNDGMDIALVAYNPASKTMKYALARRPLYVFRGGELIEIKGTKRSIGDRDEKSRELMFEGGEMQMQKGDMVFMFSDGIADQFGAADEEHPHGKRLKSVGLKKILQTAISLPLEQQRTSIKQAFKEWKGNCQQTDDVSLICIAI